MKSFLNSTAFARSRAYACFFAVLLGFTSVMLSIDAIAQASSATCNTFMPITSSAFNSLTVTSSQTGIIVQSDQFSNKGNITDADLTNSSHFGFIIGGSAWIQVKDNNATTTNVYPIGSFAGFAVNEGALSSILGTATITTYLGNTEQDSKSGTDLLSGGITTGISKLGFYTTKTFDRIRFSYDGLILGSVDVYYPIVEKLCAATSTALVCNTPTSLAAPAFPAIINAANTGVSGISIGSVNNAINAVDNDPASYAELAFLLSVGGNASLSVADPKTNYPAGTYAGFDIQNTALLQANVLGGLTISTYKDGNTTAEESFSGNGLISLSTSLLGSNTRQKIGFITTKEFDEVKITLTLTGASLGTTRIYGAVFETFCAGPTLVCNTPTHLTSGFGNYPVVINGPNTGISGISVGSVNNSENAIDTDPATYAEIALTVGVGGSGSISIKDAVTTYPAGTFAGFDINSPALAGLSVLGGLRISTYLNGVPTGDFFENGSTAGASVPLLSGTGRQVVGFLTSLPFNEVQLTVSQTVGVNLGTTQVFGAVFTRFCVADQLVCNTLTSVTNPGFPVFVDGKNTGITSIACVACTVNNPENVIDSDPTNAATIIMAVGAASSGSFAVANALETYAATSFAGFDVETTTLLSAGALSNATISLYNNGALVQTGTGDALIVGAASSLLTGTSRQIVGLVATVPYDEVKISFNQLAGANLGNIKIYGAIFDKLCQGTIACNNSFLLTQPDFPVVINSARTGVAGAVCALCNVQDAWNVISASKTDFAQVSVVANVGASASISVVDPISTYPAGTTAGFTIRNVNNLVELDLLNSITVQTYNDGVLQETKAGSALLNLNLLNIVTVGTGAVINPSFVTTKPFDEIRISFAALASVINVVNVYGAFVDTRGTISGGALSCNVVRNPDFNVTQINVPVPGNVSTNDKVPTGTTYGPTATADAGNPAGAIFTLNPDGTYTFTPIAVGVYTYQVPVCVPDLGCTSVPLVITVTDPTKTTNKPVANTDIAAVTGDPTTPASVTINVKANDGPGNTGGTLGDPTPTTPAHGTVSVVGGNVVYTPTAGYYGEDMFTYTVCETPGLNLCATATVYVTVKQPGATNTTSAADDYVSTAAGITATGNVSTNDTDPEGNTHTVTPQSITNAKGVFTLLADGSFTFVPASGATGPVDFIYTTCDNGTPSACATATLHVLVKTPVLDTNPDFAVTNPGIPAVGNVSTNDNVPTGTTYGTPVADAGNPNTNIPTVNSDGTYTFTSPLPGTYKFEVPVCPQGQTTGCGTETLTITVLDPNVNTNPPVVNPDVASVKGSDTTPTPVTINIKANDGPGNLGGTLGTPTIPTQPAHGTASIDGSGNMVYTPAAGFYGEDIVTYNLCESPSGICRSTNVVITVLTPNAPNSLIASDDYASTPLNTTLTVSAANGVLANDKDPDGNTLTATAQNTTIANVGTLVLAQDGSYTFTPVNGYTGPATFIYEVCDGVSGCKTATLHILVRAVPDLVTILTASPLSTTGETSVSVVADIYNVPQVSAITNGSVITVYVAKNQLINLTFSATAISVGGKAVQNSVWTFDGSSNSSFYILKTSAVIGDSDLRSFGLQGTITPGSSSGVLNITSFIDSGSGGEINDLNNSDSESIVFFKNL
ncbi:Ig-like domain-containing protein [Dyadobacter frigoris]|uniref:Tandem-95 repeat protein n=1 Tax=Dyadobacter frigoris TaxID=2576211 RepID=A0A4V6BKN9_9BACT|nr:Ig-like domain-containing protein [Dyadobacter frigoris]TKT93563.1 tandem-95 repeat protein [Dyadobacter frigoris]